MLDGVIGKLLRCGKRVASIRLASIHKTHADEVAEAIRAEAPKYGCLTSGLIRMPTNIRRWTVNRSHFVNSKSKESFEMRRHQRLIEVFAIDKSEPAGLIHALMERPPLGAYLTITMHWEEPFELPLRS
ncbi:ribosomal protein S10p/S20e-domain-containing protein [Pavlovales sp. CCMP2436]|nr:ribosomal protein S10p/S20e-domain-containing protein [Pavlovales sp. CCMP2436]